MDFFKNKKLLILGGAEIHSKVVRAAKEMGIYTIVIDNLDVSKSPAKQIADEHHLIDIFDVEGIIKFCKENSVDGVINTSLDPCQITQSKVCDALNLPCYGTHNQYLTLTNKTLFKKFCTDNGVDVIEGYSKDDVLNGKAIFPIFIKPVDSRGSRGQSICHNIEEAKEGIKIAESISTNGDVLIEQYLENKQDFMLCYIVIDSEPHLVRVCDRFEGSVVDGLDKVGTLALNPSKFTKMYIEKVDKRVKQMIKNLGIKYGPIFLQGFVDNETVRMYDPGLRLPGGNYENLFKHIFGVDIIKMLIEFSLTGKITNTFGAFDDDCYLLSGKYVANLFPMMKPGKIAKIEGFELIQNQSFIISAALRHGVSDVVDETHTVSQRIGEFNIVSDSLQDMKKAIKFVYDNLKIYDEKGNLLNCSYLDLENI